MTKIKKLPLALLMVFQLIGCLPFSTSVQAASTNLDLSSVSISTASPEADLVSRRNFTASTVPNDASGVTYVWSVRTTGGLPVSTNGNDSLYKSVGILFSEEGSATIQVTATQAAANTSTGIAIVKTATVVVAVKKGTIPSTPTTPTPDPAPEVLTRTAMTTLTLNPASASIAPNGTKTFIAIAKNFAGTDIASGITYAWAVTGGGHLSATTGNPVTYTAGNGVGTATISVVATQSRTTPREQRATITITNAMGTTDKTPAPAPAPTPAPKPSPMPGPIPSPTPAPTTRSVFDFVDFFMGLSIPKMSSNLDIPDKLVNNNYRRPDATAPDNSLNEDTTTNSQADISTPTSPAKKRASVWEWFKKLFWWVKK